MEIKFGKLTFAVEGDRINLRQCGSFRSEKDVSIVEVHITGENKLNHMGAKMAGSSEGARLKYVSHAQTDDTLEIVQKTELIETKTVFQAYAGSNALRVYTEVKNISDDRITLEEVSALIVNGLGGYGISNIDNLYLTRFVQSHHAECQPRRNSFYDLGMFSDPNQAPAQKRIALANVGSWSTKEELPQGIIEDTEAGSFTMFQIESNASWYYEISDRECEIYLYLGGPNLPFGGWSKHLQPGESYHTLNVALAFGDSLNEVLGEMTKYRRAISGLAEVDSNLPTIFNEYMHLAWDSARAENTLKYAPIMAQTGVEYYVMDCGWHNEEDPENIYLYVGQWMESKARFPQGVRVITDYIHSLGMKAGLWIEPEVVGIYCEDMLKYYDDDCFIQRYGKRIITKDRYLLDFRHPKVISYLSETIRRMVEDYGADYIKYDYNRDLGVGTDLNVCSMGEGLELNAQAFLDWIGDMRRRFPNVVFEACASGGMRMDYKTMSVFSLVSTSDQVDYIKYPYIAGNITAGILPEQAAVWSYPVGKCTKEEINDDQIVMNMINSFLGRMHLASHLDWMDEHQMQLVKDGVKVYNDITPFKKEALPVFPLGFTGFGDKQVCSGLRKDKEIYLAVWCLGDELTVNIPLDGIVADTKFVYPYEPNAALSWEGKDLTVTFQRPKTAAFLKITLA